MDRKMNGRVIRQGAYGHLYRAPVSGLYGLPGNFKSLSFHHLPRLKRFGFNLRHQRKAKRVQRWSVACVSRKAV